MNVRTFLIHLPPSRAQLLPELKAQGFDVSFFTTTGDPNEEKYRVLAPGIPHCSSAHALSGRSSVFGDPRAASVADIAGIAANEAAALQCLDRSNSSRKNVSELHSIYLGFIARFRELLARFNPELVVFTDNPHHGWDNVLYDLCRLDRRQTIITGYTDLEKCVVLKTAIEDVPGPSLSEMEAIATRESAGVADKLPEISRDAANLALHEFAHNLKRVRKQVSLVGAARLLVGRQQLSRSPPIPLFFEDETPRHASIRWLKFVNRLHGRKLFEAYDAVASFPDLTASYVYFPLPMQPEMSTVPLGGYFGEQLNLIRTVSEALPAGWHLYVKEHPHQFGWPLTSRGRSARQYDQLAKIPHVTIVKMEAGAERLARHAKAIATATGTSGFEGIGYGVPALVFGAAWYRKSPGAHQIGSVEECRQALARIAQGQLRPDPSLLRAYKHLMVTKYGVEAVFDPQMAEHDPNPQKTAAGLAQGIRRLFDSHRPAA